MDEERDAWIELASPETADPGPDHPYSFGVSLGMSRLMMAHERIGTAFRGAYREIMFAPGELDRREREMVAAVSAAAQDCFY